MNEKVIRALHDDDTITIYQAYNRTIADHAVKFQTFVSPPFKKERMTWIKPSFLWMMYRSGWATKENQEHILAIKIKRKGFEWALENSCLSHFDKSIHESHESWKESLSVSPVRIQWDPEKDILLQPLSYRSIQIGLSATAVEKYVSEWIVQLEDVTAQCREMRQLIEEGKQDQAYKFLPIETLYLLPESIERKIGSCYKRA